MTVKGADTELSYGSLMTQFNKIFSSKALDAPGAALTGFKAGEAVKETREILV